MDEYFRYVNQARRLDGLPPLKRSRADLDDILGRAVTTQVPADQDEELLLVAEADDEIFMVKRSSGAVIESKLTTEERKRFDVAHNRRAMSSSITPHGKLSSAWESTHRCACH